MLNPQAIRGEHILQTEWSLWYQDPTTMSTTYGDNIKEIYSFQSVENFWRLYNNIIKATELKPSSSYYLFRKGILPQWEDIQNQQGGRWIHYCNLTSSFETNHNSNDSKEINLNELKEMKEKQIKEIKEEIEEKWMNIMLACIGEDFPMSENVKGCVINCKRNQIRISLWINCKENQKEIKLIGNKLKMNLNINKEKIVFHFHQNDSSSYFNLLSI